jgi:hypothetical protein
MSGAAALLYGLLLLGSASAQEPEAPPEAAAIPAEEIGKVPFEPTSVLRDGDRLYLAAFSARRLAVADLAAKAIAFHELPDEWLAEGSSVAARGDRLYVSRRLRQEIVVLDGEGRLKSRFSVSGPPSALAVDHLGGVHVFSVLPARQAPKALLTVYNGSGAVLRHVGALPEAEKPAAPLARRGEAMPLLRTDARGDVWALLRGGQSAIRVGITESGQDVVDLTGAHAPAEESEASREAREAREREIRAELETAAAELKSRPEGGNVTTSVARSVPLAYSDFACGDRECVAVPARPLESSNEASSVRLVVFDLEQRVEPRELELEGRPTALVGILYEEERYALYALRGDVLVRYSLTGI